MTRTHPFHIALTLAALFAGAIAAPLASSAQTGASVSPTTPLSTRLPVEGNLPSLGGAIGWINSDPLTPTGLRGKVVLVDFWTYTCINWLRSEPYVRAWAEKYKDAGLVVIGVHTPEFPFEHNIDNVRQAAKAMKIDYPIAVDSDYAIWRAFKNQYWPALYFIDAQGHIRHHQFGEGDYAQSERILQQLLAEAGHGDVNRDLAAVEGQGIEAAADWDSLKSPENYLGLQRTENFASSSAPAQDKPRAYAVPGRLALNHWALAGNWTMGAEVVVLNEAGGRIAYRFHARDLHLVLAPSSAGHPVRFRVKLDGVSPGANHGVDVDAEGVGSVAEPRLYQLIRQAGPVADRTFEIEFLDPGISAYAFTFG